MRTSILLFCLVTSACGDASLGDTPDAAPSRLVSLVVEPADQELMIDGANAATASFTAIGTFDDGHTEDITARTQFLLGDGSLGSFNANQFTSTLTHGGRTRVVGAADGVTGDTGLVVRLRQRYSDPGATGLPADPSTPFTGPADAGRAPDVVYPNDGVLLPPNLLLLEVHFRPGTNNTLFELTFKNDLTDVTVYTRCTTPLNGGCIYKPDATVWTWIAETNRGGDDVVVSARATDDAGTGVGTSTDLRIAFAYENVKGGIYYWKASGGAMSESAIMRYDFGSVTQTAAERFVGPDQAGGKCVGCHALSRDGKKMVASAGGWDVEDSLMVDVSTAMRTGTPAKTAFASWAPDGSKYVGVFGFTGTTTYDLMMFDAGGAQTGTIDVGATSATLTSHPDWAPNGTKIIFTRAGAAYEGGANNQRLYSGAIQMVEDAGNGTFGAPITVVPSQAGVNRYYPAFSPDSMMIAFNESTCPSGSMHIDCNADSDPSAKLFITTPQASAARIALARANAQGKTDATSSLTNSWPKWAPFEFQRTSTAGTKLMWLTFSSSRNLGLRAPPAGNGSESQKGTLLWMVAIDPDRVGTGQDPSYAAFALPFQDVTSSNHIAQWTEEVIVLQ